MIKMSDRTITEKYFNRLLAEAEEADLVGNVKIAENITKQLEKTAFRKDQESYTYTSSDYKKDVEENLWKIIIRTADFHGVTIDSQKAQEVVDFYADKVSDSIRSIAKIKTPIGSYEPKVPGEEGEFVVIEVES